MRKVERGTKHRYSKLFKRVPKGENRNHRGEKIIKEVIEGGW